MMNEMEATDRMKWFHLSYSKKEHILYARDLEGEVEPSCNNVENWYWLLCSL